MLREMSLEEALLDGFEFPVALVVEVTKQGVVLSKMRYLKALGDMVNQTIRCASIEMYAHTGSFIDPHLKNGLIGPIGIDLIYSFRVDKQLFNEAMNDIRNDRGSINMHNPQTRDMAKVLLEKIRARERINFRRLTSQEQGLILEPYTTHLLMKAGKGRRHVLQNVELLDREGVLKYQTGDTTIRYRPAPAPTMEVDVLMITELESLPTILKGLERYGFIHQKVRV